MRASRKQILLSDPIWKIRRCADIPATEEYALRWLYWHTGGASWTNKTNWLTSTTAGNWFGVTVAGGHVTHISLFSNNLVGSFTGWQVGAFTSLVYLALNGNASLSGSMDIGNLSVTINQLYIYGTATVLTGSVAGLVNLTSIYALDVNTLSGSVAGLVNLSVLFVEGSNTLSGSIAGLTNLTSVHVLGNNTLSGSVAGLVLLTALYVTGNNTLTGSVAGLINLTFLVVSGNNTLTWAVGPLTKLNTLGCSNNALPQSTIDTILHDMYTARAAYVAATLTCTMGGTNAAPSGIYQNSVTPSTGKEYQYKLVVNPDSDHTTAFTITTS